MFDETVEGSSEGTSLDVPLDSSLGVTVLGITEGIFDGAVEECIDGTSLSNHAGLSLGDSLGLKVDTLLGLTVRTAKGSIEEIFDDPMLGKLLGKAVEAVLGDSEGIFCGTVVEGADRL